MTNKRKRRQEIKQKIINALGGKCRNCGYDKFQGALEFHHTDPDKKEFNLGSALHNRSLKIIIQEAKKCVLLCSNCHKELHGGLWLLQNIQYLPDNFKILTLSEKTKHKYICKCGNKKSYQANQCKQCNSKSRHKVEHPDRKTLKFLIENYSYSKIGRKYKVCDNTIRKWARNEGFL